MAGYIGSKSSVVLNAGATAAQGTLADTAVQPADNISTLTNDAGYLTVAPAPFVPLAVTGTTPSLDVGTYNFFDNGTLTGDTTVTFASVPTQARWTYSFVGGLVTSYDLSIASYVQSFSVAAQDTAPYGVFFKPDGTKMYIIGVIGDAVYEYSLSTAWNISTASYVQSFSVAAQEAAPVGLFFKPDGTKMYVTGAAGLDINEYSLSTAWDISTTSYVQSLSVSAQDTFPTGLFFKPDGTKMYVTGTTGQDINEYSLSTAWNISTASYAQNFSVAAQDTAPYGVSFNPDGTKMFVIGQTGDAVYEYSLSTAWNISTASYVQNFSVAGQEANSTGLYFKPDGSKMYVTGNVTDAVYEYDTAGLATITLPASVQNTPQLGLDDGARVTYEFFTLDGGTTVYLIDEEVI